MVSEAAKGSRGRREFRITRSGLNELQKTDLYLTDALEEQRGDLESVLRLACIAISEAKAEQARPLHHPGRPDRPHVLHASQHDPNDRADSRGSAHEPARP